MPATAHTSPRYLRRIVTALQANGALEPPFFMVRQDTQYVQYVSRQRSDAHAFHLVPDDQAALLRVDFRLVSSCCR